MKKFNLLLILSIILLSVKSQNVAINTDGSTAQVSAILDVKSNNKGVLIPRLTNAQKLAIPFFNLTQGLLVYDIDEESFSFFNGFQWCTVNNSVGGNLWRQNGTHIFNNNAGNVGIGTFFPAGKLHVADESVFFTAPLTILSGSTNIGVTGEGIRTVWFPARAAFRAGGVTGTRGAFWDRDSIGEYSAAFGLNVKAKGPGSFAQGNFVEAIGENSFAVGNIVRAYGISSIAMGLQSTANGEASVAIGVGAVTNSNYSFTAGFATRTYGNYSTSIGLGVSSYSYGETVFGAHELPYTPASTSSWVASDRLFSVGNGSSFASPSNALTILKNGNLGIGTTAPNALLQFPNNILNRKIVLWESANNDHQYYGFGINGGTLRYQTDAAAADHVFFSGINSSSSKELMRIKGNGAVGIGINNPSFVLEINGRSRIYSGGSNANSAGIWFNNNANTVNTAFVGMESDNAVGFYGNGTPNGWGIVMNIATGNVGIGTSNPSQKLHVMGNILATGTITPSEIRYKQQIKNINNPIDKLQLLNGVTYKLNTKAFPEWEFDNELQYGLIAQEVEKVFPEMVKTIDEKGYKGVDYVKLIPVLIEAIKEQQKQIDELKQLLLKNK